MRKWAVYILLAVCLSGCDDEEAIINYSNEGKEKSE